MAVSATTIKLISDQNTARENPVVPGTMLACWVVNLTCNLGQVRLDVGVAGEPEDATWAGLWVPDRRQSSEGSLDGSGVGRKGRNWACSLLKGPKTH
jgi:hypothetical protein